MMALVIIAALLALAYVAFNYAKVKQLDEGTEKMKEIASAIRIGANAFISYEYRSFWWSPRSSRSWWRC